jgi:hypothetical protein
MINEKPSIQAAQLPDMPAMLYPRGGINVCLFMMVRNGRGMETVWSRRQEERGHIPRTTDRVAKNTRSAPKTGKDLDAVYPETCSKIEAR